MIKILNEKKKKAKNSEESIRNPPSVYKIYFNKNIHMLLSNKKKKKKTKNSRSLRVSIEK